MHACTVPVLQIQYVGVDGSYRSSQTINLTWKMLEMDHQ
jgi:hypothetical protein